MDQHGNVPIKDFTLPDKPKPFKVDESGEVYVAPPLLPPSTLVAMVRAAKSIATLLAAGDEEGLITGLGSVFTEILDEETGPLFVSRLSDKKRPVDLKRQVMPILQWLMEEYGLRPTTPSSDSSTTSTTAADGTPSTAGAPDNASTPSGIWTPDAS